MSKRILQTAILTASMLSSINGTNYGNVRFQEDIDIQKLQRKGYGKKKRK